MITTSIVCSFPLSLSCVLYRSVGGSPTGAFLSVSDSVIWGPNSDSKVKVVLFPLGESGHSRTAIPGLPRVVGYPILLSTPSTVASAVLVRLS